VTPEVPSAALVRWAQSLPAVRCVASMLNPWTLANAKGTVPPTTSNGVGDNGIMNPPRNLSIVAEGANDTRFELGTASYAKAAVFNAGGDAAGWQFNAVVGDATPPPQGVYGTPQPPKTADGLGLGSSRADIEAAMGPAHPERRCGYDVVKYVGVPASALQMWFVYRTGRVVAFARFETL